jgi:hypothetical protein
MQLFARAKRAVGFALPLAIVVFSALLLKFPTLFSLSAEKVTLVLLTMIGLEFLLERLIYLEKIPRVSDTLSSLEGGLNCFGYRGTFGTTEDMLKSAKAEIFISGLNLNALSGLFGLLEEKAKLGLKIRLLAVQPDPRLIGEVSEYFGEDKEAFEKRLDANLSVLSSRLQRKYSTSVELRTTQFRPSFGYAACDPESANGFIRVESYTCRSFQTTRPMMQFKKQNRPSEFTLYYDDLKNLWKLAKPYQTL